MKELCSLARNLHLVITEGGVTPQAEVILAVSEPCYRIEGDKVVRAREAETFRVGMCRKSIKELIEYLNSVDDELGQMEVAASFLSPGEVSEDARPPGGQTP